MINWKQKLQNPFALVAQGFVVGLALFWATVPQESIAQDDGQPAAAASFAQASVRA